MSEPPCTADELKEVLQGIIKDTKNALRDLTMKTTLKKAEEKMKLETGTLNGWHRQWADDILCEVLAVMLEENPAIADSLDEDKAPAKKAARKPAGKKSEKKEEEKKDDKEKKEGKEKKEKKEEAAKKEAKEKKISAYIMFQKDKDKGTKGWKELTEEEKAKYQKQADEANKATSKEEKPKKDTPKASPKAAPKKSEKQVAGKKRKGEDEEAEPASKKSKTEKKPRKPRGKKAVEFYMAANKQLAMDALELKTYNMPKCQAFLRKQFAELSDKDKAEWVKKEEEDAKRVQAEAEK